MIRAGAAALRAWGRGRGWAGAWVESLRHPEDTLRGLADLHPGVFAVTPRLDVLHAVATWQRNYKRINLGGKKGKLRGEGRIWGVKGNLRAKRGDLRAKRGKLRGKGGYLYSFLSPVPLVVPSLSLVPSLSPLCPHDDLHIVDNLEVPSRDPRYLQDLARFRHWGSSVLLVDVDEFPENISAAAEGLKSFTLIPALGLNVHSLLKHQTLVLTLGAVTFLEQRLLWHDSRYSPLYPFSLPYRDLPGAPRGG
ncbi:hypothetical protein HGM15179_019692 [Zosterops borbonicus]|uniref:Large ribosomal subunit protein uL4m n=1 Tax=Zosterops borbonicus TaxID=364589 RepID=A0A8K1FXF3_9PASS|nr:hypothetical protein HGM15179_019692 [Zosterops borbonicus]